MPMAIGTVLAQEDVNGKEHHVAFASKMLKGPEPRSSTTSGECFAGLSFLKHFRHHHWGTP